MTIVHIGPSALPVTFPYGGAIQRRIRALAKQQAAAGHDVVVCNPVDSDRLERAEPLVVTDETSGRLLQVGLRCKLTPARDIEFLCRCALLLKRHRINPVVVHYHSQPEGALLGPKAPATILSFDYFKFRRADRLPIRTLYRALLTAFSTLTPCSRYCELEAKRFWGLKTGKTQVVYNGVDLDFFAPDEAGASTFRQMCGIGPSEQVVLFVGRWCAQKGNDLFEKAANRLSNRARFLTVGPSKERFGETGWSQVRCDNGVIHCGPISDDLLRSAYSAATIVAMPTRQDEMFGMAALEALACGTPVVAANLGGLPEVVSPDVGVLFEPEDLNAFVEAITNVLGATRSRSLAIDARRRASKFSWQNISADLESVYIDALKTA